MIRIAFIFLLLYLAFVSYNAVTSVLTFKQSLEELNIITNKDMNE